MVSSQATPIAIIGMSCISPHSRNLRKWWKKILIEVDCIAKIPTSQWNLENYFDPEMSSPDKTFYHHGGFIPDLDFNPMEFGLPPNILEITNVFQLLNFIVTKEALIDAGYTNASETTPQRTGIALGVGGRQNLLTPLTAHLQYSLWERVLRESGISEMETQSIMQRIKLVYVSWKESFLQRISGNIIAGHIVKRFNLGKVNYVVDTAFANSSLAMQIALSELGEGRSDMMITGGGDAADTIFMYTYFSKRSVLKQQMIHTFDTKSNRILIGMLILKRLEDAERDGSHIYAVIKGIGTSSGGRYKSICVAWT